MTYNNVYDLMVTNGGETMACKITDNTKAKDIIKAFNKTFPFIINFKPNSIKVNYTKLYIFGKEIPTNYNLIKLSKIYKNIFNDLNNDFINKLCLPELYIGGIYNINSENNSILNGEHLYIGNEEHIIELFTYCVFNNIDTNNIDIIKNKINSISIYLINNL
jgi:hypothetical protein